MPASNSVPTGVDAASEPLVDEPFDRKPGTRISHYRITRKLGQGGMGAVYLAYDEQLNRDVAIKILKAHGDERARRRLLREARAAAALDHPSICAVHEVGSDPEAGDFIVMQYLEGKTLAERLVGGPLRTREALAVCRQLAEALGAAHRQGVVHRDLKPQNVIIDVVGCARLLDFGIAHTLKAQGRADAAHLTTQLTDVHAVVGTPPYMSPEQVQGAPVDARSDLFSLGCVLYECLTGQRAFDGATAAEICGRVLHVDPAAPSTHHRELTAAHDALCLRLLEKEPSARFQSADEVVGATRMLETSTGLTPPVPWRPSVTAIIGRLRATRRSAVATGVCAVALAGVLGTMVTWPWATERVAAAPDDARHWYEQGVGALRTGSYAGAVASLEEAVRLHPAYAHAYSRLAEAHSELDNPRAAENVLLRVNALVPDQSALDEDEGLRLTAVRASVLRDHHVAEQAYATLAARYPANSGLLVDLARAQDAAGRSVAARETLAQAIALDRQNAAAHLRLGVLEARLGQKARALEALDESARLYRAAANTEGEIEAVLRRGMVLSAVGELDAAQVALQRVMTLAADTRYRVQRLRAQFELAAVASSVGRPTEAQQLARSAVEEASEAGLHTVAANGLIDLADALLVAGQQEQADEQLVRAIALAEKQGAFHTAMRGRLQQAALREATGQPEEALRLAASTMEFFADNGYTRWEALARSVISRAHGSLERYGEASAMAAEVLRFAESVSDEALAATALENLASQLAAVGRLPEALTHRERIERIHRQQDDQYSLPYDLANRAELLIRLGRGVEAEALLVELDAGVEAGRESYVGRQRRSALLRAWRAAIEGRDVDVEAFAMTAIGSGGATPDTVALLARALTEYARARLARPGQTPTAVLTWGEAMASPMQREVRYWVARTLIERRMPALAVGVLGKARQADAVQQNTELRWRLAAAQVLAGGADTTDAHAAAAEDIAALAAGWGSHITPYLARADLAPLHALIK